MMPDAISAAQIALLQDQLRMQSINQNISNLQTPGYKRQVAENGNFESHLPADISMVSQQLQLANQFSQGSFIQTENPLDLALDGDGFFEVQTDEGLFYTRRGDFQVNEQGYLTTVTGAFVTGKSGRLLVEDNNFTVDPQGALYMDNRKVDQLNIVHFTNPGQLHFQGQGLYSSEESADSSVHNIRVMQGSLEQSNVKSLDEMMELVKTSRHFQAVQQVMKTADNLLSKAINQLGES